MTLLFQWHHKTRFLKRSKFANLNPRVFWDLYATKTATKTNESLLIMTVECYKSVSNMFCLQWCYWLQDSNVVSLQRLVNFASPIQLSRSLWSNVMSKSSVRRRSLNDCGSSKTWSIDRSSSLIIFPLIWASHGAIGRNVPGEHRERKLALFRVRHLFWIHLV